MSRLDVRVQKLEASSEGTTETPNIIVYFVQPGGGEPAAVSAWSPSGSFKREDGENEKEFKQRVETEVKNTKEAQQ